jgi:Domain of unknown function (DUF4412)
MTGALLSALLGAGPVLAFEGRINVMLIRNGETNDLLYTVGPEQLRIAVASTNGSPPVNIVDLKTGAVTLVFPHNLTFVRLTSAAAPAGMPAAPAEDGAAVIPVMPALPLPPDQKLELKQTTDTKDIQGFPCTRHELKQHGQTLEVWATDALLPFQPRLVNQPSRFGPPMIEERWPELLKARKLFPLLVSLRDDNGFERLRFAVQSVKPEKISDPDGKLFQPPKDYHEIQPLPF